MPIRDDHLIIFDFDGVIVNTLEMCAALAALVNQGMTRTEYLSHLEGDFSAAVSNGILKGNHQSKDGTNIDFYEEYAKGMGGHKPEEAMPELIRNLGSAYPLAIISSTRTDLIMQFLTLHGLQDYFQRVVGEYGRKTDKIKTLLEEKRITSHNTIMITDTLGDMREATECGVKSIGVTWGYHPKETLAKGNPLAIVESPSKIPEVIETYFGSMRS